MVVAAHGGLPGNVVVASTIVSGAPWADLAFGRCASNGNSRFNALPRNMISLLRSAFCAIAMGLMIPYLEGA